MIHIRVLGCPTLLKGRTVVYGMVSLLVHLLSSRRFFMQRQYTSGAYSRNYCPGPSDGNMNKRTQLVGCAMDSLLFALVFAFTFLVFVFGYRCCSKLCWVRLSNYQLEPKPRYLTRRTNVIWPWLNGDHNNIKIVRHFKDIFTSFL